MKKPTNRQDKSDNRKHRTAGALASHGRNNRRKIVRRKRGGMAKGPGATQKEREKRGNDAGGETAGAETGTRRSAGAERADGGGRRSTRRSAPWGHGRGKPLGQRYLPALRNERGTSACASIGAGMQNVGPLPRFSSKRRFLFPAPQWSMNLCLHVDRRGDGRCGFPARAPRPLAAHANR